MERKACCENALYAKWIGAYILIHHMGRPASLLRNHGAMVHMDQKLITLIGGSGFVGRYAVRELAKAGYRLRVVCRRPEDAQHLTTAGDLGQIALMRGDMARPETVMNALKGADAVVNLVGILYERGSQRFNALHAQGAERIAQAVKQKGIPSLIHISALGVDRAIGSQYARTKMLGENAVRAAFPEATVLRPSVIFGTEDNFFNQFARMATLSPCLPLIGGGETLFQPVYVVDVAKAIRRCLEEPACRGKTYELGGPDVYTFRQLMQYILKVTGRKRCLVPIPFGIANVMAFFTERLPKPLLTRDQVRLLRYDNIVDSAALTFASLGMQPTPVELVVPEYLARFHNRRAIV